MRLQARTCVLLLVAVLATPTPIGTRVGRTRSVSDAGTDPSDQQPAADRPLGKTGPESSSGPAAATTAEPPPNASPGEAWQVGTSEPPVEIRPLLDIDELLAYERRRARMQPIPRPPGSASGSTSCPDPVTAPVQPAAGEHSPSQLAEVVKSVLDESTVQGPPTTQPPSHPPGVDLASQKPPLDSSGNTTDVEELLPQLEEVLKNVLAQHSPAEELQPPPTDQLPLPQNPKVLDTGEELKHVLSALEEEIGKILRKNETKVLTTISRSTSPPVHLTTTHIRQPSLSHAEEDLKHILPALKDAISSILKDSEATVLTTTSRPTLPPVHPTTTHIGQPSLPDAEEDLCLKDTIGSILKDSEAKIPVTTGQPALRPVHLTVTDIKRPSESDAEDDLKHIFPTLEEALGSILENSEAKLLTTTSRPVHSTVTDIKRPSESDAEDDLKDILPTLEEALGGILEDSEARVSTTTSRPAPVLPPVCPTAAADSREQFAAVLPQLEEAIRSVLDEAVLEQEAAAQEYNTPAAAWQPSLQATEDYGFGKFLPHLELVFGDILRSGGSDHTATVRDETVPTSTAKTPILPVIAPAEDKPSLQTNVTEPNTLSSHSEPLFQAIKSTLQDVFNNQEVGAKTPRANS